MRAVRRPLALVVALLALAATTTACVGMPEAGPVVTADVPARNDSQGRVVRRAQSPQENSSRQSIVQGFLLAMRAYPVDLQTVRQYLTSEEQDSWDPSRRIITYGDSDETGTREIKVRLDDTHWVDSRGSWRGRLGDGEREFTFPLVKENGQWRIAAAPNAFLVPADWFGSYYQRRSVYFFDPTGSILVAEPVWVPVEQSVSGLVGALLRGPGARLGTVDRTFVPEATSSTPPVTIGEDRVAHVTFDPAVGRPSGDEATLMAAQLAATLAEAGVQRFTVSIGSQALSIPGASSPFDVRDWPEYAPSDQQASPLLWGVRSGNLEVGDATAFQPVDGPFGSLGTIESVAVSLSATYAAAVVDGGTTLLRGSVNDDQHPLEGVVTGTRLLRPGWDFSDRLWSVDRTSGGAVVRYLDAAPGAVPTVLPVPGISGERVRRFIVSPDGTRLVAVVRGPDHDELRASRIAHDSSGKVIGAARAHVLPWTDSDTQRIKDIAWRSPTLVGALHLVTTRYPQVVSVSVDGAGTQATTGTPEPASGLVSSARPGDAVYTFAPGQLFGLDSAGVQLPPGFTSIQYAG